MNTIDLTLYSLHQQLNATLPSVNEGCMLAEVDQLRMNTITHHFKNVFLTSRFSNNPIIILRFYDY